MVAIIKRAEIAIHTTSRSAPHSPCQNRSRLPAASPGPRLNLRPRPTYPVPPHPLPTHPKCQNPSRAAISLVSKPKTNRASPTVDGRSEFNVGEKRPPSFSVTIDTAEKESPWPKRNRSGTKSTLNRNAIQFRNWPKPLPPETNLASSAFDCTSKRMLAVTMNTTIGTGSPNGSMPAENGALSLFPSIVTATKKPTDLPAKPGNRESPTPTGLDSRWFLSITRPLAPPPKTAIE